ncbi:putative reverse transcriptase domain-containing protein [Tanacetum coccineum]|uniref:Reverse transcriptase domain-containing protein n=1 Tax=Tanacetum coccineum TaxID=301880 RepID=A0ABQ5H044_9ASTR
MAAKQLEDIHNFKQEGDESLYQAWELYNDMLYKCPTYDINSHQKVNIFYKGLSTMNRQLLDSQGPIPGMRPAQALIAIQTIDDHSQKWHDETTSRSIRSSSNNDGLAALVNKLDNLGRDMNKLKESVHVIQVGCQICEGPHLDKDCPLNEEVKQVREVRYGEFRRTTPFNGNNGGKFCVGPPVTADLETSGLNKLHGASFISGPESNTPEVLQHQLPPKELNTGSFTLPCTIGKFNFYVMADLDMSKKAPLGIVENVLVKIDKFLFPSDFVIIDNTPSETTILGTPFLATIHAEINVFAVGHTDISKPVKKALLKLWLIDCFQDNSAFVNNPTHRSFDDYKWEFNLEIDKLSDEYELGIGKKGHILDNIWEYYNQVHNKNYEWHNYEFKNEECEEIGIDDKDYHLPKV